MPPRLAFAVLAGVLFAACTVGTVPTPLPTLTPTAAPTQPVTEAPETPGPTVDPVLVAAFCDPFATDVLPAWPPTDAALAGDLHRTFRAWAEDPDLEALADEVAIVLAYLADARTSSEFVSPTTAVADAFARVEAFAAESC